MTSKKILLLSDKCEKCFVYLYSVRKKSSFTSKWFLVSLTACIGKKRKCDRKTLTVIPELAAISTSKDTIKNPLQLSPPGKENIKSMFLFCFFVFFIFENIKWHNQHTKITGVMWKQEIGWTYPISISLKEKWKVNGTFVSRWLIVWNLIRDSLTWFQVTAWKPNQSISKGSLSTMANFNVPGLQIGNSSTCHLSFWWNLGFLLCFFTFYKDLQRKSDGKRLDCVI